MFGGFPWQGKAAGLKSAVHFIPADVKPCQPMHSGQVPQSFPRPGLGTRCADGEERDGDTRPKPLGGKRYKPCLFSISTGWERQILLYLAAVHLHTQLYPPAPAANRELGLLQGAQRIYTQAPLIKKGVALFLELLWMHQPQGCGR